MDLIRTAPEDKAEALSTPLQEARAYSLLFFIQPLEGSFTLDAEAIRFVESKGWTREDLYQAVNELVARGYAGILPYPNLDLIVSLTGAGRNV
jgi:hypothetical protein